MGSPVSVHGSAFLEEKLLDPVEVAATIFVPVDEDKMSPLPPSWKRAETEERFPRTE